MTASTRLSAARLHKLFLGGELSAVEIVDSFLTRIAGMDPGIGAYITVTADIARERAWKLDARRQVDGANLGPLAGVPVAVKDNICTLGVRTSCGSRILESFVPPYDATVMTRLQAAGAILIGKTNMDEFAMGSSTENSGFFPTRNPWRRDRVPGGSSGGSAAAVAADLAAVALGSDTGGSIRQPAAYCGVVGMKPTYGAVSRYGLVAFASSLDQIGPVARDVADCARLYGVIAGHDRRDSTSAPRTDPPVQLGTEQHLNGLRVGVPKEYLAAGIHPEVRAAVDAAVAHLAALGATVDECSLPHTEYALSAYYLIAPAEASANLARYDGVRYGYRAEDADGLFALFARSRGQGFGAEVKRRIMLGTYALSSGYYDAYYKKAQQVRTLVVQDFQAAFSRFDVLVTPTAPGPAFRLGELIDDPLAMYLADVCTIPVNLAGLPAISLPCGLTSGDEAGLPIGLQIIGPPCAEAQLLNVASVYERTTSHHEARPALGA